MGLQRLKQSKVDRLADEYDLPFAAVATQGDQSWVEGVTWGPGHRHYAIDRRNHTCEPVNHPYALIHWTTCKVFELGPPPEDHDGSCRHPWHGEHGGLRYCPACDEKADATW